MKRFLLRLLSCVRQSLPKASKLCLWLMKIILPISLLVRLLQYWGVIDYLSDFLAPIFNFIGLPGESAIVFITSCFFPLYAPIAVMTSIVLTMREATILALMCLISHNLPVECAITHKTGSPFWRMVTLRVAMSFVAAIFLNWVLPDYSEPFGMITQPETYASVGELVKAWALTSLSLIFTIILIVTGLMSLHKILEEFNLLDKISAPVAPIMHFFGMSDKASFLWIVGNLVGLSYGGAIMVDMVDNSKITKGEAHYVNSHLSMSHSLIEDTLLFVVLGISVWWIMGTRLLFALLVVWTMRAFKKLIS